MTEFITAVPRADQDKAGLIRTFSGRYVEPLAMTKADICIEDIAHHLSNECRYNGATPRFYSVAQHSCVVAQMLANEGERLAVQMAGLLHDASEAYLKDIPSPVKHNVNFKFYREIEAALQDTILSAFDIMISPEDYFSIKDVDHAVFKAETDFFWGNKDEYDGQKLWLPDYAETVFLAMFHKLQSSIKNGESI